VLHPTSSNSHLPFFQTIAILLETACFFFLHALVTLSIWLVKMKGNLRKFTRQSAFGFYTFSIQPCLLSFTLFWTLFYGLVYLY
jgi:hypothetical protein